MKSIYRAPRTPPISRLAAADQEDIQDQPGHADARTARRYDHGGVRLDMAMAGRDRLRCAALFVGAGDPQVAELVQPAYR